MYYFFSFQGPHTENTPSILDFRKLVRLETCFEIENAFTNYS